MRILTITTLSAGVLLALSSFASAAPLGSLPAMPDNGVTQVAGGCGPGFFRGPYGGCRRMGFAGPRPFAARACPPGFRLGPYGRRCRPVY